MYQSFSKNLEHYQGLKVIKDQKELEYFTCLKKCPFKTTADKLECFKIKSPHLSLI